MTYEEKRHSFAEFLKSRQIELKLVPDEVINSLDDDEILESYRTNSNDDSELYSKEQERWVLMEYETNEAIMHALENFKYTNHIDETEQKLLKEFSSEMVKISASNMNLEKLNKVLSDFKKLGIELTNDDLDKVLEETCSMFALWILEGCKYFIKEEKKGDFSLDAEKVCSACLLKETLHNYKSFLGWSLNSKNADGDVLRSCNEAIISDTVDYVIDLACDKMTTEINEKKFDSVLQKLFDLFFGYLMNLPLISCWLLGKELAQKRYSENEEKHKFLCSTYDYFSNKYKCIEPNIEMQFYKDVENYLKTLQIEQLETLYDVGFPVDMLTNKQKRKVKKLIEQLIIKISDQQMEENHV